MTGRCALALLALLAAAAALPAAAQSRFGVAPGEAGQGRVCYFGECSQQSGSYSGSQPAPVTAMSVPAIPCAGLMAICAAPGAGSSVGATPPETAVLVGRPPPPGTQEIEPGKKRRTAR